MINKIATKDNRTNKSIVVLNRGGWELESGNHVFFTCKVA